MKRGRSECPVCLEEVLAAVTCNFCQHMACKECTRDYILSTTALAHCMECKNPWGREFCANNLTKAFMNKEYKCHRKQLLFETEKARFPATMPDVEKHRKIEKIRNEERALRDEISEINQTLNERKRRLGNRIAKKHNLIHNGASRERKKFVKKCPLTDCEGFLSAAYKCGACERHICAKCMELKTNAHKCDADVAASIAAIKADTKPCPACHTSIYKISGCDQMWCTNCNIAFSWRTGLRVNGVIHNPHYFEFQQTGATIRRPGDVVCGGMPNWNAVRGHIHAFAEAGVKALLRSGTHFNQTLLRPLQEQLQRNRDHTKDRVLFINGEIDKKNFETRLIKADNAYAKAQDTVHIYEFMSTMFIETARDIVESAQIDQCVVYAQRMERLHKAREYCNAELRKISKRYKQQVIRLDEQFVDKKIRW